MPKVSKSVPDLNLLNAALEGLELQRQRLDEQIQQVRKMLGGRAPKAGADAAPAAEKESRRKLSPAARKRIAAAQKKRWAEYRKNAAQKS